MTKFIFRFPTTKRAKVIGGMLVDAAYATMRTADKFGRNADGTYTDLGMELANSATDLLNKAAHQFGFLSWDDMQKYEDRHGKI